MKIRVLAEEKVYKEYFVEVPEQITSGGWNASIHQWIDENFSEFNFQAYDSDQRWIEFEKVKDNEIGDNNND